MLFERHAVDNGRHHADLVSFGAVKPFRRFAAHDVAAARDNRELVIFGDVPEDTGKACQRLCIQPHALESYFLPIFIYEFNNSIFDNIAFAIFIFLEFFTSFIMFSLFELSSSKVLSDIFSSINNVCKISS